LFLSIIANSLQSYEKLSEMQKEWRKNIRKDDREEKSMLMKQTNKTALIFRSKSTKKDFALKIAKMAQFHNLLKINAFLFLAFNI